MEFTYRLSLRDWLIDKTLKTENLLLRTNVCCIVFGFGFEMSISNLGASVRLQVAIDFLDIFALGEALGARVMVRVSLPSAWRSSPMFFSPSVQSLVVFEGAPHQ